MSFTRLQQVWEHLGRRDPLWAVCTQAGKSHGRWDVETFLATGRAHVQRTMNWLAELGVPLERRRALDFGCGAGRLTQALAQHFEEAVGVDVALAMVQKARELAGNTSNCTFIHNAEQHLGILGDGTFDLVCSFIVLQHMPPTLAANYVREFVRVLAPGGAAVFQVPSHPSNTPKGLLIRVLPRLWLDFLRSGMGMYGSSPEIVESWLRGTRGQLVGRTEDQLAGKGWISYTYCVRRS